MIPPQGLSLLSLGSGLGHGSDMGKKIAIVIGAGLSLVLAFFFGQKRGYHQSLQERSEEAAIQATKSNNSSSRFRSALADSPREDYSPGKELVRSFFAKNTANDPKTFQDLATRALEINNTTERKAAIRELMNHVDNADQILAIQRAFAGITWTTGRDHGDIWKEFLNRSGEKLGVETLDAFATMEGLTSDLVWNSFRGFASRDPEGALQWLEENSERGGERWREGVLGMAMESAVLYDPPLGEMLMNSLSEQEQLRCLKQFCTGLIQAEGIDGGIAYYRNLESGSDGAETPVQASARYLIHDRIKRASAGKEGVSYFVDQVAQLHEVLPFKAENFGTMSRTWSGKVGLTNRLDFLESVETQFGVTGEELAEVIAMSGVLDLGQEQSDRFEQWIQEHPDSALLDDLQAAQKGQVDPVSLEGG